MRFIEPVSTEEAFRLYKRIPWAEGYRIDDQGIVISCRNSGRCGFPEGWYKLIPSLSYCKQSGCTTKRQALYVGFVGVRPYATARLVLTAWVREPKAGEVAEFLNGDMLDTRLSNLRWSTTKLVHDSAIRRHGKWFAMERNWKCIMSREQVVEMRRLFWVDKIAVRDLAKRFKVSNGAAYCAIHRESWKDLPRESFEGAAA